MRTRLLTLVMLALSAAAAPAAAQWDSPSFFSPRPGEDLGLYLVDGNGRDDVGLAGIWRQSGNLNLGVRAGIMEDAFSLGAEFYGPLSLGAPPLLMSWNLGAGATFGDNVTYLRIPLGVSIGALFGTGNVRIMPYIHPRVAFDMFAFEAGDEEETDTELEVPIDLGADFLVGPSFVVRVGATFNDGSAFGIGGAYRVGRNLVVR